MAQKQLGTNPVTNADIATKAYVDALVGSGGPGGGENGGSANKLSYVEVSTATAAGTAAKVGTTSEGSYTPTVGDIVRVTFSAANTAASPTLNIDGSGAKAIQLGGVAATAVSTAGTMLLLWYDGTSYQQFGSMRTADGNTTYVSTPTTYTAVTGTTQTMAVNVAYLANHASTEINFTLPATAAVGVSATVQGLGVGRWRVTAPSGDNIIAPGGESSASAGYIAATNRYDTIKLVCIVANTTWLVVECTGTLSLDGTPLSSGSASEARTLVWNGTSWPDRPNDTTPTFFVGGASSNAPVDTDIKEGDLWFTHGGIKFEDLDNVLLQSLAADDLLYYDASMNRFMNRPLTDLRDAVMAPRVTTLSAPGAVPVIDTEAYDQINFINITNITSMSSGLTGYPPEGKKLLFRFLDNGSPRTISWGSSYIPIGVTLPTTTVASKVMYIGCINRSGLWDVVAVGMQS